MPFAVFGLLAITVVAALLLFAASASIGLLIGRHGATQHRDTEARLEQPRLDATARQTSAGTVPGMAQADGRQRPA